jgi:TolB-like protein
VFLQFADFVLDAISAPNWILQVFILAAAIGLPVALIISWVFEMTPDGIKRESQIDRSRSDATVTGRKLDRVIITFMAAAILILVTDRLLGPEAQKAPGLVAEPAADRPAADPSADNPAGKDTADPHSIAVLPFVNMSSDLEQEYFSDGITEEILNRLAGVRGLQVAARTSAFSFKGDNRDVREIAQLLGVANILEGSVRKAGDQVRITAQLIRASDGFHLWSEAYDRKLENIFAIQEDIANQIADSLEISLSISGQPGDQPAKLVNPEVYDLYLRARALHRQRGTGLLQAIDLFQQSLAIDPDFAPAWAGLSHSYIVVPNYVSRESWLGLGDVLEKSMAAAERALALDPKLPTALHAMGNNLLFRFEWARAQEFYLRALELDPDSADIMEDYASLLIYSWQLEAAQRVAERMVELDPQVPIFLFTLGIVNHALGEFEERDRNVQAGLNINPDLGNMQYWKLFQLLQLGQFDEAREYATQMNSETINVEDVLLLIDWVSDPEQVAFPGALASMQLGAGPALLAGRYDFWLDLLDIFGAEWPEWKMTETISLLAPLASPELMHQWRADPRTKALLNSLRLPEYWRKVGWPEVCRPLGEDDFECF